MDKARAAMEQMIIGVRYRYDLRTARRVVRAAGADMLSKIADDKIEMATNLAAELLKSKDPEAVLERAEAGLPREERRPLTANEIIAALLDIADSASALLASSNSAEAHAVFGSNMKTPTDKYMHLADQVAVLEAISAPGPTPASKARYALRSLLGGEPLIDMAAIEEVRIDAAKVDTLSDIAAALADAQPLGGELTQFTAELIYPATLTDDLRFILGRPNFSLAPYAHLFRKAGAAIKAKAEDEQAFVLDKLIRLYLQHGDGYEKEFDAELNAAYKSVKGDENVA